MPVKANPIGRFIAKPGTSVFTPRHKIVCRFCDTTAPTKEGLLSGANIVSNLHGQVSAADYRNQTRPPLWCAAFSTAAAQRWLQSLPLPLEVNTMADNVVPHFHNDAGVSVIEIGSQEFMCVGANPPFDHPHVFLDLGNDNEIICPYCSTLYRFATDLSAGEARPPECVLKDVA
jgi:uncharacterized Zn-finger protein